LIGSGLLSQAINFYLGKMEEAHRLLSGKKLTQDLVDGYQLSKLLLQGQGESELNFHELANIHILTFIKAGVLLHM
jgi:hypothetical protein